MYVEDGRRHRLDYVSDKPRRRRDEEEMEKYYGLLHREASMDPFEYKIGKRLDYLSWDEYFMDVAFLSSMRSKDPSTQVGACLVDADKCIVGIGCNGFPRGCSDDVLPWSRSTPNELHRKYVRGTCRGECNNEQMQCQHTWRNAVCDVLPM